MLFDFSASPSEYGDRLVIAPAQPRWGADSEYGLLKDVMLGAPDRLDMVPCCAVTIRSLANGLRGCPDTAASQHATLRAVLEEQGVRCRVIPAVDGMPDLAFARDATFMTPWGLLQLAPAAAHRRGEAAQVAAEARNWGVPLLGAIDEGLVEGGDICLVRPGVVAIGYSGQRTDDIGARAVSRLFEARGWRAIRTRFDPDLLHLDTHFTMLDRHRALACIEALDGEFQRSIRALGIELVPVTREEVDRLGGNVLSLGGGVILSPADNVRINGVLTELGYDVIPVAIDQFTRCGGGIHCLTMPLARASI